MKELSLYTKQELLLVISSSIPNIDFGIMKDGTVSGILIPRIGNQFYNIWFKFRVDNNELVCEMKENDSETIFLRIKDLREILNTVIALRSTLVNTYQFGYEFYPNKVH